LAWTDVFDNFGVKVVTNTDKNKAAYVIDAEQLKAINAAGLLPSANRPADPFRITIIGEARDSIVASYYHAERRSDPGRIPEPRIGRDFISTWLEPGDQVLIGNIGSQLFAARVNTDLAEAVFVSGVMRRTDPKVIRQKAKAVNGRPKAIPVTRYEFYRSPFVVQAVKNRSNGFCEMIGCVVPLFKKDDGLPYLEVHHITPLAEGGEDSLLNTAALCPKCHRELHHGADRLVKREALRAIISRKELVL
jgi:5-methylcytosine-specific restriction endonuclease McrA